MWRQAGKRTNNNLTPETRTHSSEVGKKQNTQESVGGERLFLVISRTEHIVIRRWQCDEMCEVGKRRWQEEGTHPVTTSDTTANSDRALINSSTYTMRGKFVYRHHIAQPYISTVSHSDDFSIYKLSLGLLANGKMFFLEDKRSKKICFCWWQVKSDHLRIF